MDYNKLRLGSNIRALRKKRHMSANQLAQKISIAPSYLGLIERGQRGIRIEKLCELCDFFNVSLDNIVYIDMTGGLNVAKERGATDLHSQIEDTLRGASDIELELILNVSRNIRASFDKQKSTGANTDMEIKY